LVGNGAREHAIAAALHRSGVEIVARMDKLNPGIARLCSKVTVGSLTDPVGLPTGRDVDYAIIGPETPIAAGFVDTLETSGVRCVAPKRAAAQIETSKSFARILLSEAAPEANARFFLAHDQTEVKDAIKELGADNVVVKPDGLTGGKGVKVLGEHLSSIDEATEYATALAKKDGIVIIEEKVRGTEFTVQAFVDGMHVYPMPLVRDYKRAYDGDRGPNTGSMGSYSSEGHRLSYVGRKEMDSAVSVMERAVNAIRIATGTEYVGVLYGQFMKSEQGVRLIEFNARFGDPEAINVLSILSSSMDDLCCSLIDRNLMRPRFESVATVCVYLVPNGYPSTDVAKDSPIDVHSVADSETYYASVYEKNGKVFTTSSRAVALLGKGSSINDARARVYRDASLVKGHLRYRSDIAEST